MLRQIAVVSLVLGATACSLLLESSPSQCDVDGDCQSRGGAFATSVCAAGRCVAGTSAVGCATNVECTQKLGGPAICRSKDRRCAALLSPECTRVVGDVANDDTILIGTIFATTGTNGPSGLARQSSAELALDEIKQSVGGIRSGPEGRPRPLALVECDDAVDSLKPARHLVDEVGVQAIVGIASSSRVTDVATSVTIPKGVLVVSPTATSPTLTSLPDANLVWRTSPSDALQAIALVDQLPALEAKYRADNAVPAASKVRVSFLYINESYGLGLYEAVTRAGELNGKPLGDAANAGLSSARTYPPIPPDLEQQVAAVLAESPRPSIIVAFGSTEVTTQFITPLEKRWGTTAPRPVYLLADAAQKTELLDLVAADNDLRKRIRGSIPAPPRSSSNFKSFVFKYEGMFGSPAPSTFGMAGTYDAMFLLAYSVAAAGTRPLTGDELQKGFGRLVKGAPIDVGGTSMNTGFQALAAPGTFDFDGASGPLDFDLATGEARSNIDVWCIAKDANGRPIFVPSSRFFDAKTNAMSGAYDLVACRGGAKD
ncbi:MAG: Branched-chain amino acid transporter, amino acid-binding protein [Labilithrix sp.]|nr:Branched-chain amino acid transporter, amino acid-binding protein [Labilithrix sp.]